jgi:hypothetical protein
MTDEPLPGLVPRAVWAANLDPPRSDYTARRWMREGKIVVRYLGNLPFVDTAATAARMRGEDKPKRCRGRAA